MKTFKNKLISLMTKYGILIFDIIVELVLICCTIFSILEVISGRSHIIAFIIYTTLDVALFIAIAVEITLSLRKNKNDRT